jgi:hypothetical protein
MTRRVLARPSRAGAVRAGAGGESRIPLAAALV